MSLEVKVDITEMCNYDGECLLSKKNQEHGHGFCYGSKYGTEECPLFWNSATICIKDKSLNDFRER